MKRLLTLVIVLVSIGAGLILSAGRSFSKEDETTGGDFPSVSSRAEENASTPVHLDGSLHFEANNHRTTSAEREIEETLFHRNILLNRFQNADSKGQVLLSFSAKRVDLILRTAGGMEASILSIDWDATK